MKEPTIDTRPTESFAVLSLMASLIQIIVLFLHYAVYFISSTLFREYNEHFSVEKADVGAIDFMTFVFGALGFITGFVALSRITVKNNKGEKLAWTGILVGFVSIALSIVLYLLKLSS